MYYYSDAEVIALVVSAKQSHLQVRKPHINQPTHCQSPD